MELKLVILVLGMLVVIIVLVVSIVIVNFFFFKFFRFLMVLLLFCMAIVSIDLKQGLEKDIDWVCFGVMVMVLMVVFIVLDCKVGIMLLKGQF